jgi:pSer/pThr/pTyr-binding forkhead associated (FHA) protein
MEFDDVPYSYVLQRCGPGEFQRVIQLNESERGTIIGNKAKSSIESFVYIAIIEISGRAEDTVTLNSLYVSREHLQICFNDNKWTLIDMNSFNNTFVYQNGHTVILEPFVPFEL